MTTSTPITWTCSARTDVGKVREHNEDACLARPEAGLWVVADGMGGHSAGDVASKMIVDTLGNLDLPDRLSEGVHRVEEALLSVNAALRELAARQSGQTVGSTVVALLCRGRHAVCLWAGDSRAYRLRGAELVQVTQDHALVEEYVEKGLLSREQAASHPQGNLVTRAIGATDQLYVDAEIVALQPGDRFVICSDGLDKEVAESEIAAMMARSSGEGLSDRLVDLALERGSRDNVTVVSVVIDGDRPEGGDETARYDDEEGEDTVPGAARPRHADGRTGARRSR